MNVQTHQSTPQSVRDAALEVILGDLDRMMVRAEQIAQESGRATEHLHAEFQAFRDQIERETKARESIVVALEQQAEQLRIDTEAARQAFLRKTRGLLVPLYILLVGLMAVEVAQMGMHIVAQQ